ncbi:hypothetical protein KP509_30G017100 [Ceratopteris richardii]|uniref:Leucine-rich repeat-containing N-terminal plant-type domain-containing protein n=1 Tax=Ceratopteris richardii TaxID=49495 RepID=A0A8T2R283_CERRI|nr:hypothetical protein KP509_30G017100 [Ceratopteris richardii]
MESGLRGMVVWFVVALLLISSSVSAQGFNSEVDALIAFKRGVRDPDGRLDSWDATSVDPCTWFLVTCDSNNRVQRLSLGRTGISGTISPTFGQLSSLQYLDSMGNKLTGRIPPELVRLSNLVALHLMQNELSGPIAPQLTRLWKLQFLNLSNNNLSGRIPTGGSFSRFSSDRVILGCAVPSSASHVRR